MKLSLKLVTSIAVVFAFFLALTSYTNSSFLLELVGSEKLVDLSYLFAGVLSCFHIFILAHSTATKRSFAISFILLAISLVCMLVIKSPLLLVFLVATTHLGLRTGLLYIMDLLVEEKTPSDQTGTIRGRYMAFQNFAWVIGPLCAGFIVDNLGGQKVLYISSLGILLVATILVISLNKVPNLPLPTRPPRPTKNDHIKRISSFVNTIALNSFYALMIIGMPLYLTSVAGWNWSQIGLTFTLMLAMFPLVQYPLGSYLDTHQRQFRVLSGLSFFIMALSSVGILLVAPISYLFGTVLFITSRIGVAALEVASDTIFFDTVSSEHKGLVAWYRALVPIAYTLVPFSSFLIKSFTTRIYILSVSMVLIGVYYVGSKINKKLI